MTAYLLRRLMQTAMMVVVMSVIVFFGVHVIGDPVWLLVNPQMDQSDIEAAVRALGLDRPIWEQYLYFVRGALQGDLGRSFIFGEPALTVILQRMPATLELALGRAGDGDRHRHSARPLRRPQAAAPAVEDHHGRLYHRLQSADVLGRADADHGVCRDAGLAAVDRARADGHLSRHHVEPFTLEGLRYLFLPALNLALLKISLVIRLTRAGARESLQQDYIKFARAKGLTHSRIVRVHLLKNILIPVVTVLGLEFGNLIAFSVVTETIFAWPGMGKLLIGAIQTLDRPVIVAHLIIIVLLFVVINLVVDVLYTVLDPRVRIGRQTA